MNDEPAPLEPTELDEYLSADLDGELAAAASDNGSDVDAIRARIAATPNAVERRAALAAARAVLSEPPGIDELVATRLRAKAVRAAEGDAEARLAAIRRRRTRTLFTASGIAASILVVVAIAFAAGRSNTSESSRSLSAGAPKTVGPKVDLTKPVPALGSYTDADALGPVAVDAAEQRAAMQDRGTASTSGAGATLNGNQSTLSPAARRAAQPAAPPVLGASNHSTYRMSGSAQVPTTANSTSQSVSACSPAKFAGRGDQLVLHASATVAGQPVDVYVFEGHGEHTVVLLGPGCALVDVQTLS